MANWIGVAILVAALAVFFIVPMWKKPEPLPYVREGFAVAKGAGMPDCLRLSQEASDLFALIGGKPIVVEEGADDFRELTLLLSKLCCFKKDLMSPATVVEATRYQPYSTSHDIEPVAETTARCFAKVIPERDLDIILAKWSTRGEALVKRLCTAVEMCEEEAVVALGLFKAVVADVSDVAKGACLSGDAIVGGALAPRDQIGFEPPALSYLRTYEGYY